MEARKLITRKIPDSDEEAEAKDCKGCETLRKESEIWKETCESKREAGNFDNVDRETPQRLCPSHGSFGTCSRSHQDDSNIGISPRQEGRQGES